MYSNWSYGELASLEAELERELNQLLHKLCRAEDEDEAEAMYRSDIDDLEDQLSEVRNAMCDIDEQELTAEYYASVL